MRSHRRVKINFFTTSLLRFARAHKDKISLKILGYLKKYPKKMCHVDLSPSIPKVPSTKVETTFDYHQDNFNKYLCLMFLHPLLNYLGTIIFRDSDCAHSVVIDKATDSVVVLV